MGGGKTSQAEGGVRACDESPGSPLSTVSGSSQHAAGKMAQIVAGDAKAVGKHRTPVNSACLTSILCAGIHPPTLVEETRYC